MQTMQSPSKHCNACYFCVLISLTRVTRAVNVEQFGTDNFWKRFGFGSL